MYASKIFFRTPVSAICSYRNSTQYDYLILILVINFYHFNHTIVSNFVVNVFCECKVLSSESSFSIADEIDHLLNNRTSTLIQRIFG